MNVRDDESITRSSGNVFADMRMENPGERSVKAQLASRIYDRIQENSWTQSEAARVLGVSQPDVSRLVRGILGDFSVERLLHFLTLLDYSVSIQLRRAEEIDEIIIAG